MRPRADGAFDLRWFTPEVEVDLCGHATLASAHVLWETGPARPRRRTRCSTPAAASCGPRAARRRASQLDFPVAEPPEPCDDDPRLLDALGDRDAPSALSHRRPFFMLVELADAATVRDARARLRRAARARRRRARRLRRPRPATTATTTSCRGASRRGSASTRTPVTGSMHCVLAPYWCDRLGPTSCASYQASARGGELHVAGAKATARCSPAARSPCSAASSSRSRRAVSRRSMRVLVTGAAGFIGSHVSAHAARSRRRRRSGSTASTPYYDPQLKERRLARLTGDPAFELRARRPARSGRRRAPSSPPRRDRVVHLAAQAGVRHSLTHPHDYVDSNVTGTAEHPRRRAGTTAPSTSCTRRRARCTVRTRRCRSPCTTTSTIR